MPYGIPAYQQYHSLTTENLIAARRICRNKKLGAVFSERK